MSRGTEAGEPVRAAARHAAAHVLVADLDAPDLEPPDRHHLERVLRLRAGETVGVTDGRGGWRACRLGPGGALVPDGPARRVPRPAPPLTVALAAVKGERPEWAVQKLTELGVDRVVLLHCERSVVRWDDERAARHVARLAEVARQAAMQSRRLWWPEVAGVTAFADFVTGAAGAAPGGPALADPEGAPPTLDHPTVLVGPEGGWGPSEQASGLPRVTVGPGVLRTESAAVAAGALLAALRAGIVAPVP